MRSYAPSRFPAGAGWLWSAARGLPSDPNLAPHIGSFSAMLSALLAARAAAAAAGSTGEMLATEWWEGQGRDAPPLPPSHVLQARGAARLCLGPRLLGLLAAASNAPWAALPGPWVYLLPPEPT
jgi:hypothetical protein